MSVGASIAGARRLLALDATGAGLTAGLTLSLLATGVVESGVPRAIWAVLGGLALVLCVRGLGTLRRRTLPRPALRSLAVANVAYAAASIGVVAAYRDTVTALVVAYVALEVVVLLALAASEWRAWVASR